MPKKLTKSKLDKFIKVRNESDLSSNFQFAADASACGFDVAALGDAKRSGSSFMWNTPFGRLVEYGGKLRLETDQPTV